MIHRDVKPGNIRVAAAVKRRADSSPAGNDGGETRESQPAASQAQLRVQVKLTDFGIGQVVSEEALKGMTKAGFTQTIIAESSSLQTGSQMYMAVDSVALRRQLGDQRRNDCCERLKSRHVLKLLPSSRRDVT